MIKRLFVFSSVCICILFYIFLFHYNKSDCKIINLKFSTWGSASELKILKPIISDFERQNPNIHIELIHVPQDYFQKIHLLFASNLEPDVLFINNLNLPIYKNYLLELSDYIDKTVFYPKSIDALSVDNNLYAIPRDISNLVVFYNKSLFDKYSISYPNENWSLDELLLIAEKFKKHNIKAISYEPSINYALPYMLYFGGGILSDNYVYIADSANSQKGINFYKNLAYKYHYAPTLSEIGSKTVAQLFLEQKIAMHLSGRWLVPKYRQEADFVWDVVNFPKYTSPYNASGWAISKKSSHINEAVKFVLFLSNKTNISKMASDGLIMPAREDVANSNIFMKGNPKSSFVFIKSAQKSPVSKVSRNYNKYVNELNRLFY